jgi:hypothetical protein
VGARRVESAPDGVSSSVRALCRTEANEGGNLMYIGVSLLGLILLIVLLVILL